MKPTETVKLKAANPVIVQSRIGRQDKSAIIASTEDLREYSGFLVAAQAALSDHLDRPVFF
jgi:hypothetical protein